MPTFDEYKAYQEFEEGMFLEHYGIKRHSGRYPWGSGDEPYQHDANWLARVERYEAAGVKGKALADKLGITTTQLRTWKPIAKAQRRALLVADVKQLSNEGMGATDIARKLHIYGKSGQPSESTVRSYLSEASETNMNKAQNTAKFLMDQVDEKGFIDVSKGVERQINISKNKKDEALQILQDNGYNVYKIRVPQITNPANQTIMMVAAPPIKNAKDYESERAAKKAQYAEVYKARDTGNINSIVDYYSTNDGSSFQAPKKPVSIDSKRIQINYAETGGKNKDGVIELRRGTPDLNLGNSHYAQVRIAVDGTHYLKGMAVYADDLPKGIDIRFNTNKSSSVSMINGKDGVLKQMKSDPKNPFGALIMRNGQSTYVGTDGKEHLSAINKIHEEGDWSNYQKQLPAQFLAKQNKDLVKKQLDITYADKLDEYDEIKNLTNPTIKKYYLNAFAKNCDKAAVNLKAAALPRQKYQVILPVNSLKDNEIFAPNYNNGEQVALIRFPHGGTFEIPVLTVNNKNTEAIKRISLNAKDAVGINKNIAERLSGADFDGDDALVIPTGRGNKVKITSSKPLEGLVGFDPSDKYPEVPGMKCMKDTQKQMGVISNLITDMTIQGAEEDDLARAVRHSMVVIDAEKHKLNYKQSEKDNGIEELKARYQRTIDENGNVHIGGSSTLLSRAKSDVRIPATQGSALVNIKGKSWYDPSLPEGAEIWKESGRTYIDKKTGKEMLATKTVSKMASVKDARELSSGSIIEETYAQYANRMKDLANDARKESAYTPNLKYSAAAKDAYAPEVKSLSDKLDIALKNAPRERQAQIIATGEANERIKELEGEVGSESLKKKDVKKIRQQAIEDARSKVGMKREDREINITDREWEAIQAGAISDHTLSEIMNNTDKDKLRERAMPKSTTEISQAKQNKIRAMSATYTNAEIAEMLGVSTSTVSKYLKEN